METLNAKQEAIKKAYCNNWDKVKDYVDENGWIFWSDKNPIGIYNNRYLEYKEDNPNYWRPKSLQGIENNTGWIKIESEDDLPKEGMHHSILLDSDRINGYRNYDVIVFYEVNSRYRKKEISHYKPIEKPKPPIY